MKYTKGEWKVGEPFDKAGSVIPIYGADRSEVARVFIHNGEQFANAHLMARAPELYEALKEISEGKGRFSLDPLTHASNTIEDMKNLALAALAKAEVEE